MNDETMAEKRCANDACPRPAETGERFCAECGLERSLYKRNGGRDSSEFQALQRPPEAGR
jgi:hypothetical protein